MKLSQRLAALEADVIDTSKNDAAAAFAGHLAAFIDGVFPEDPSGCRMDQVARCCGLPNAGAMRSVFAGDMTPDALRSAAVGAYGNDWREKMAETMEGTLNRVCEVHGDDGPMLLARAFPGVLIASRVAFERMRSGPSPTKATSPQTS